MSLLEGTELGLDQVTVRVRVKKDLGSGRELDVFGVRVRVRLRVGLRVRVRFMVRFRVRLWFRVNVRFSVTVRFRY